jgi:hypothetical protein
MLGLALSSPRVVPDPDGDITIVNDRIQFSYLYRGIDPVGSVAPEAGSENQFFRRRRADR